jgi:hypothetical protein
LCICAASALLLGSFSARAQTRGADALPTAPAGHAGLHAAAPGPLPAWAPPAFSADPGRHYHWTGMLVQSFEFNALEDMFRLSTDNVLRTLTVDKPYWHDYISSLQQFNMRRWNDGDDFLVNYVGHPMQGGVASYIEIQNSPAQSRVQWGDPGYWSSRTKAFLWSTAYSTYSEIGPTGEAGIGNEGGYTYDDECILHCSAKYPPSGRSTNNTG